MIAGMRRCESCEDGLATWRIAIAGLRRYRTWREHSPGKVLAAHVCDVCAEWLAGLVLDARTGETPGLLGAPTAGGRHLVFDDQCAVCCGSPTELACAARWEREGERAGAMFLCAGCGRWLLSLARAGRTARGLGERSLDGPYGSWPHPRLRGLRWWIEARDAGLAHIADVTAAGMGMVRAGTPTQADVVIVEASASGRAREGVRRLAGMAPVLVAAPAGAGNDALAAMSSGAARWVTVPVTPQQLTWAMARVVRGDWRPAAIDPGTGLAVVERGPIERPWLAVMRPEAEEAWMAAWLVRRFSRGYDEVAIVEGELAVVPVAPPGAIGRVRERLLGLLGPGWGVEVDVPGRPTARRLDAAG